MEQHPNSAALGAMGPLLMKLNMLPDTEDKAKQLRGDLGIICSNLEKLAGVSDPPLTVKYWMIDARELSYDMEVWVDQFVHARQHPDEKKAWNTKILGFEKHVKEVKERCDRYNLVGKYVPNPPTNTVERHRLGTLYEEPKYIVPAGMEDDPTERLLELVKPKQEEGEDDLKLKVVCIHGVDQGVGKSTLAQELWRKLDEGFQHRAFVQTAKRPDTRMILRSILSQVRVEQPPKDSEVQNLIDDLWKHHDKRSIHSQGGQEQPAEESMLLNLIDDIRKHLQHKRYFIVIEDLWAVSVWDIVRQAFPDGTHCSRIVITTVVENVAQACCSYDHNNIVSIKHLDDDESKKLFVNRVYGFGKECAQEFSHDLDEITRKCGGLPLAIICAATIVASQRERKQLWEYVNNFLSDSLKTSSNSVEIPDQVLKLCYSVLPRCLKTFLLYLSVYPENYLILKEDLVKQWIAEDFICKEDIKELTEDSSKDIVEVAKSCFDELVSLGLIQQMDIFCNKKGLSYVVHPMVFDFVKRKSMEENFVTTIDYSQSTVVLTDKIRRLALHFGSATYPTAPKCIGLSEVRSLSFMGLLSSMPSLAEFKLVRVVILHFWADDEDTSFPLSEICELLLLRYLQVRCNVTVKLPDQIQCLKHLEALEINAVVAAVPLDILSLPGLLHVRLGRKAKHTHLTLGPVTSGNVSSSTSSHPIQVFELLPPICIFSKLPWWFKRLHGLCTLEVVVRELGTYEMEFLAGLQALTDLSLYVRKPTVGRVVRIRRGACSALKYFKLVSGRLLLSFEEGAMPNLQMLEIAFNAHKHERYGDLLQLDGIEHLSNLQEVAAGIGVATGAEETDRITAESAFWDAIGRHPCRSNCKVKRADPIDEERDLSEIEDWSPEAESSNVQDKVTQPPPEVAAAAIAGHKERGQLEIQDWNPGSESSNVQDKVTPPSPEAAPEAAAAADEDLAADLKILTTTSWQAHERTMPFVAGVSGIVRGLLEKLVALRGSEDKRLLAEFEIMLGQIQQYESHSNPKSMIQKWANDVSELAYDTEDWVDLFTHKKFSSRRAIFNKIKELRGRIIVLNERGRRILLNTHATPFLDPRLATLDVDTGTLIGLDGPVEEVVKMVTEPEDKPELKVVSIVGMAGSGKTSLAKAVYERLSRQNCFDCQAFVSVGQAKDMVSKTLTDMLRHLGGEHRGGKDILQIPDLIVRLREVLHNKRCLIVFDDLWSREDWKVLSRCFPEKNHGSTIITTARNSELTTDCSSGLSCHVQVYKIGLLSDTDSKKLLLKRIFGKEHDYHRQFEDIFAQILRRCGGLPLALVTCASILANNSQGERDRLIGAFALPGGRFWPVKRTESGSKWLWCPVAEKMTRTLNLSYNDLPPHLKTCLLYLSIFPENYAVDVERLVRRWIVEVLKIETRGVDVQEIARSCLGELIIRSMVQPLHANHDGLPRYCRVHPVIHGFIVGKSEEQNFVTVVNAQHQNVAARGRTIRRLSLQNSSEQDHAVAQSGSMDLSHARSITVFGQASAAPHLTDLRVVRVLDLEGCDGPVRLDGLEKLLLLRYLSLRGTDVSALPETIGELKDLQTLDVRSTKVRQLPNSVIKLEKLMHLLAGSAKLPCGVAKMKALQTVSCAIVTDTSTSIIQELIELADLKELELYCDFAEMPGCEKQVTFPRYEFWGLQKLCIRCNSASVTFQPGVLAMVKVLELSFDGLLDDESSSASGIEHLLSLKHVLLEFTKQGAGAMATEEAVRKAASTHYPDGLTVTVKLEEAPSIHTKREQASINASEPVAFSM